MTIAVIMSLPMVLFMFKTSTKSINPMKSITIVKERARTKETISRTSAETEGHFVWNTKNLLVKYAAILALRTETKLAIL